MTNLSDICFIDCETTGLNPRRHMVWEIGLVIDDKEYEWQINLKDAELSIADSSALRVGNYYTRAGAVGATVWHPNTGVGTTVIESQRAELANYLVTVIGGRHLAGNVVGFDDRFVGDFCRHHNRPPAWHYHLIDVESLVAGYLQRSPPWDSKKLSSMVGVNPDDHPRHTALGDARWAEAMYKAVMNA